MSLVNRFKYSSHKLIRWFSAIFLVLWLVFALCAILMLFGVSEAMIFAVLGAILFAMALWLDLPIVGTFAEIAMSILATGLGVVEAIAGRTYQTWTPARGRRN